MAQATVICSIGEKCKTCEDYLNRIERAEELEEIFGNGGSEWDYETCRQTCWKESHTKHEAQNYLDQKKRYARKHGLVR